MGQDELCMETCKIEKKSQKLNLYKLGRRGRARKETGRGKSGKTGEFGVLEADSGMWSRQKFNRRLRLWRRKEAGKMSTHFFHNFYCEWNRGTEI